MSVTLTTTTLSADYATAKTEIEGNFSDLVAKFGSIDVSDLAAASGILATQLAASFQDTVVTLGVRDTDLAAGLPASGTMLDAIPLPGPNGAAWTITDISWACNDTGTGAGKVKIDFGYFDGAGAAQVTTAAQAAFTISNTAANDDANGVKVLTDGEVGITVPATAHHLALMSDTADATTLTAAGSFLKVTLRMRRAIRST